MLENAYYTHEIHGDFDLYDVGDLVLEEGMTLRDTQLARDIELRRRSDLEAFNSSLDRVTNQTGQALRQNEQTIQSLREGIAKMVGQPGAPGR